MKRVLRENGLSIAFFGLFATAMIGQFLTGHRSYNQELQSHGRSPIDFASYLVSGHSIEAVFENWESEFLQTWCSVILSIVLFQKGSATSKPLDSKPSGRPEPPAPDAPWPVRRGGWVLTLYENSLALAFAALFAFSFLMHAVGGMWLYNTEQAEHGGAPASLLGFLGTSDFWFQSFQNYQSEFLALGVTAVLTIFLRQKGSPRSKKVEAPVGATGAG